VGLGEEPGRLAAEKSDLPPRSSGPVAIVAPPRIDTPEVREWADQNEDGKEDEDRHTNLTSFKSPLLSVVSAPHALNVLTQRSEASRRWPQCLKAVDR
jgi:hypothetical protein